MYQHNREFFATAEELTIHVVGANHSFELQGGSPTHVWEEIMHCLPRVKTMRVVFVGPEVGYTYSLRPMQACPNCMANGRTRLQAGYALTYHDYHKSSEFIMPDFVAAFNTGMFEEYTESWKTSLESLLNMDVPCIFTSYDKNEGKSDHEVLTEVNARTLLTAGPVLNPFHADIPLIDDGCIDKFFYANMYCTCFRGHSWEG